MIVKCPATVLNPDIDIREKCLESLRIDGLNEW
jgi:hypothetical protein